jgi:hypothetical protein
MIKLTMRVTRTENVTTLNRQLPFIASLAINETAFAAQAAHRQHIASAFVVRRKWTLQATKVLRSHKSQVPIRAEIKIEPPGGMERADILARFEQGRIERPSIARAFAVPDRADLGVSIHRVIPQRKRPKSFQFQLVAHGPRAKVYRGRSRTFLIQFHDGATGGIYQRRGRRASKRGRAHRRLVQDIASRKIHDLNVKTLYRFTAQARIDRRLKFRETVVGTVQVSFARNFEAAMRRALGVTRGSVAGRGSKQERRIARADVFGTDRAPLRVR